MDIRYTAVETDGGGAVLDNWLDWWAEFGALDTAIWVAICYEAGWFLHEAHQWQNENGPLTYAQLGRVWLRK